MDFTDRILLQAASLVDEGPDSEALWQLERLAVGFLNYLAMFYAKHSYRTDMAVEAMKLACRIEAGNALLLSNYSHVCNAAEQYHLAADVGELAVGLFDEPEVGILINTAVILTNCRRLDEALAVYRRAMACLPDLDKLEGDDKVRALIQRRQLEYNYATTCMANGDYVEGLPLYDARFEGYPKPTEFISRWAIPIWTGQPLEGKRILIFSEQGIGDLFQFVRFVPEVLARGPAAVYLEAQEAAADLLARNLPDVKVLPRGHAEYPDSPDVDYVVSVCSLPLPLGRRTMADFSGESYLVGPADHPLPGLTEDEGLRVGLVWAGNPDHGHDFMRSCPAALLAPLAEVPGVRFYSFQKDVHPVRRWRNKPVKVHDGVEILNAVDLGPHLNSFTDTAAYLSKMDLLITIDSAIAHLAGAMGVPTWMLVPRICDWRWCVHQEDATFWYDSMRLYRQDAWHDWTGVIARVKGHLRDRAASGR